MADMAAFTIRIPKPLADQIDMRAKLHRRTRNAEINVLLEEGIDERVGRDIEVIKRSGGPQADEQ